MSCWYNNHVLTSNLFALFIHLCSSDPLSGDEDNGSEIEVVEIIRRSSLQKRKSGDDHNLQGHDGLGTSHKRPRHSFLGPEFNESELSRGNQWKNEELAYQCLA